MAEVESITSESESVFIPIVRPESVQSNQVGSSSPEPNCAICLGHLENTSYTNSCLHQFCFTCILTWSKIKRECPLCKQNFNSIIHNVRSENDYDQCQVESNNQIEQNIPDFIRLPFRQHWNDTLAFYRRNMQRRSQGEENRQRMIDRYLETQNNPVQDMLEIRIHERRSVHFRRRVYQEMLVSAPLRNRTGEPRESSPDFYRNNPAELHRLVEFISREIHVFATYTVNYILRTITNELLRYGIQSYCFHNVCRGFMGNIRSHIFRHELWNFATSGFDIIGYYDNVRYYSNGLIESLASNERYPYSSWSSIRRNWPNVISNADNDVHIIGEVRVSPIMLPMNNDNANSSISDIFEVQPANDIVLTISDSSSSSDECEIIDVVRSEDRVFEVVELSSDEENEVIEISESSSLSPSLQKTENTETEEEEDKSTLEVTVSINLPSTSQESYDATVQSYTPPLAESKVKKPNELLLCLKRKADSTSNSDSDSSRDPEWQCTKMKKRLKYEVKQYSYVDSSSDSDDSSSDCNTRKYRKIISSRRRRISSDSSEYYHKCHSRVYSSSSSSDSEEDRKRREKTKKSKSNEERKNRKRERHRESSSVSRKDRKSSKDKKSKKHKKHRDSKHRDSKHRRSEKKSNKSSH